MNKLKIEELIKEYREQAKECDRISKLDLSNEQQYLRYEARKEQLSYVIEDLESLLK